MIYFEKISFFNFLVGLRKTKKPVEVFMRSGCDVFYIDATPFMEKVVIPLLRVCGVSFSQLDFKMMDVSDKGGELVRVRISRSELFEIKKRVVESDAYKSLCNESWRQDNVEEFVAKGLVDGGIHDRESVGRFIFILEVVAWHMCSHGCAGSILIARNRAWFDIYENYAARYKINLIRERFVSVGIFKRSSFYKILIRYPFLYGVLKNIKYGRFCFSEGGENGVAPKVYVEGRGDVNLEKNGDHSDFFWQFNSEFPVKNILYTHHSQLEKEYLENYGVYSVGEGVVLGGGYRSGYKKPRLQSNADFREECKAIGALLDSYDHKRYCWASFFHAHKVKVYLTWNKYYNHHIAVADAIKENGGISVVWQMAFVGFESISGIVSSDIYFCYSKFSCQLEEKLGSSIKYHVITGYPKDYVPFLIRKRAYNLRENMRANGAEKIIFVIDENSIDDERWHTGHGLQQENYSFILEKVLDTPWLGVIFKPKVAKTLRGRLGEVAELLARAEKTGRCYVYEDSGRHTTSAPPILAGLSADICIHGHLSAGTAALECALEGIPTLLIDREGCPNSNLYKLPKGKVIFESWPETIDAVMEHFKAPQGIPGFGDWSSIIDELDPFRDGKAAYRMGTYLHWLIQGFEKGMEREAIMADAAERYKKQWGADKVLVI